MYSFLFRQKKFVEYFLVGLLLAGCIHNQTTNRPPLADQVIIYRDSWGVPHINGKTDAATAFGMGYAQCEDNFLLINRNMVSAAGRSAELFGMEGLFDDWINKSIQIEGYSKEEYARLPADVKAILDGYTAGLNFYVQKNEMELEVLDRFESWHSLAFIRYIYYQRVLLPFYSEIPESVFRNGFEEFCGIDIKKEVSLREKKAKGEGSNSWAINGPKSSSGNAVLFINPHLSFFGASQVYEAHVISDEGWNFSGYTRFGFPLPYVGFGENLGWASTDNMADLVDAYIEEVPNPEILDSYIYEGATRSITKKTEQFGYKMGASIEHVSLDMYSTHHGPIVGKENDSILSVRMAKIEDAGWLEQWYRMTRATDINSFKEAVSPLSVQFGNFLYSDKGGNTWYLYNGAIPVRSETYDWSKPVPGNTSATEWNGYHSIESLPQVMNPSSGWVQNCNGTPFLSSAIQDNPPSDDYPSYMVPDRDNPRSMNARRLLSENEQLNYDDLRKISFDTYLPYAAEMIPEFVKTFEVNPDKELRYVVDTLKNWNFKSDTASIATNIFLSWAFQSYREMNTTTLKSTVERLERIWGTWQIPFGAVNRLQRPEDHYNSNPSFDVSKPSIALPGTVSGFGNIFTIWPSYDPEVGQMFGIGGNSYVAIVEFGERVNAETIHTFGSSGDPDSPHFFDQAHLFANGEYKPGYLYLDDVKKVAVRSYAPGEE